jgi:hypothetical protein
MSDVITHDATLTNNLISEILKVSLYSFRFFLKDEIFQDIKKIHVYSDGGSNLKNNSTINHLLKIEKFKIIIKFFIEGHGNLYFIIYFIGKSPLDGYFSHVNFFIQKVQEENGLNILQIDKLTDELNLKMEKFKISSKLYFFFKKKKIMRK